MDSKSSWLLIVAVIAALVIAAGIWIFAARAESEVYAREATIYQSESVNLESVIQAQQAEIDALRQQLADRNARGTVRR